jgi:hypothetical protein
VAYYARDDDGDGAGGGGPLLACAPPAGSLSQPDCDDLDPAVSPSAEEVCNGRDDDCDGLVDLHDPSVLTTQELYRDDDLDGVGVEPLLPSCGPGPGWASEAGDCDDGDGLRRPGGWDLCADGVDQDCDGEEPNRWGYALPFTDAMAFDRRGGQLDVWMQTPLYLMPKVSLLMLGEESLLTVWSTTEGLAFEVHTWGNSCEVVVPAPPNVVSWRFTWTEGYATLQVDGQEVLTGCQLQPQRVPVEVTTLAWHEGLQEVYFTQLGHRAVADPTAPFPTRLTPEGGYDHLWRFDGPPREGVVDLITGEELPLRPERWRRVPCP